MSRKAEIRPAIPGVATALVAAGLVFSWVWAGAAAGSEARAKSRIVIVQDEMATTNLQARAEVVSAMLNRGIVALAGGDKNAGDAWRQLVSTQDVVAIKVYSAPGPNSGTRPAVVSAVIEGLLGAGLPATNIVVWDKHAIDLRLAGFYGLGRRYGVRVAAAVEKGYDPNVFYESSIIGNLVWGDLEFGRQGKAVGRNSYLTKLLTGGVTKIINVSPLLNHNRAGVAGSLYSVASGSVDNFFRFESDRERLATAVPEIYGMPELADRVVLNIVDALLCQYEGGERALLHYSSTLNQLRLSRDPVALDVASLEELNQQRREAGAPTPKASVELYENAALLELGTSDLKMVERVKVP